MADRLTTLSDESIAAAAVTALGQNAMMLNGVVASVRRGWVTLAGRVATDGQKAEAERTIRQLDGVAGVINAIVIRSFETPVF